MKLPVPLAPLGAVPIEALRAALPDAEDPVWDQFTLRQRMMGHAATRTIAIVWGRIIEGFDTPVIFETETAPEPVRVAAKACGARLAELAGGGTITRLMLVDLPAGAEVQPHRDVAPIITLPRRCHLPVETNDQVSFVVDGTDYRLAAGQAYEFDNTLQHGVANRGTTRRVHLICDIMPLPGQRSE
ncbi:MAG TPA: aspartyl/asparaginyl beta-hydroxylase domain-containing protein [Sphingomonas sp.]